MTYYCIEIILSYVCVHSYMQRRNVHAHQQFFIMENEIRNTETKKYYIYVFHGWASWDEHFLIMVNSYEDATNELLYNKSIWHDDNYPIDFWLCRWCLKNMLATFIIELNERVLVLYISISKLTL